MGKIKHGDNVTGKRTKLYQVWLGMRARCTDPKHISYKWYGARGIYVDSRWNSYEAFKDWCYNNGYVDPEPAVRSKLEIDRKDANGPYSPENCVWSTARVNRQRQSQHKRLPAFGESKTLAEWSEDPRCQCPYFTLRNRINRGWDIERAISTPNNKPGQRFDATPHNKGKKMGVGGYR